MRAGDGVVIPSNCNDHNMINRLGAIAAYVKSRLAPEHSSAKRCGLAKVMI
jgi:hypothetical protein